MRTEDKEEIFLSEEEIEIERYLTKIKSQKNKTVAQKWALFDAFSMDYLASYIAGFIPYDPLSIRDALNKNKRRLYKMCLEIKCEGADYFDEHFGDILAGGSVIERTQKESVDLEVNVVTKKREISSRFAEKLLSAGSRKDLEFITDKDKSTIERYFNVSDEVMVISEKLLNRAIRRLQVYQLEAFKILEDFIESRKSSIVTGDRLFLHAKGGFQAGKSDAFNVMLAYMFNVLANSKFEGEILVLSANFSSMRKNIIARICSTFNLKMPAINQTVWKVGNITLYLITTQLISYHSIKGASAPFVFIDEFDACHEEILKLLMSRTTNYFDYKNRGHKKFVLLSTSNPKMPCHHVTKALYGGKEENVPDKSCKKQLHVFDGYKVTLRLESRQNKFLSEKWHREQETISGGADADYYQAMYNGHSIYISDNNSVFAFSKKNFIDECQDNYLNMQCTQCGNSDNVRDIISCDLCEQMSKVKRKDRTFLFCNIGYDHGTRVQSAFVITFFYLEDTKIKAMVLDELVYEGGYDHQQILMHGRDTLVSMKESDFVDMITSAYSICPNVTVYVPHDCPHKVDEFEDIISRNNLNCKVSRPPAPAKLPIANAINSIRALFLNERIYVSNSCKKLINQLYIYQYDDSKMEKHGTEVIKKGNDHCVDAFRYSITPSLRDLKTV